MGSKGSMVLINLHGVENVSAKSWPRSTFSVNGSASNGFPFSLRAHPIRTTTDSVHSPYAGIAWFQ